MKPLPPLGQPVTRLVKGETACAALAAHLVRNSCWFEVEPHTFDRWYFTVKREHERLLPTQGESK